jgi:hypothetical protein
MALARGQQPESRQGDAMKHLMVGIDPGVNTGFSIWDLNSKALKVVKSATIVEAMRQVESMCVFSSLHSVVFEDARMRTWFGAKGRESLQGAGSIKRDCQIWEEWLKHLGCQYKAVSPKQKGVKIDAARFAKITGWTARTNEHGRDSAMLVWGL